MQHMIVNKSLMIASTTRLRSVRKISPNSVNKIRAIDNLCHPYPHILFRAYKMVNRNIHIEMTKHRMYHSNMSNLSLSRCLNSCATILTETEMLHFTTPPVMLISITLRWICPHKRSWMSGQKPYRNLKRNGDKKLFTSISMKG